MSKIKVTLERVLGEDIGEYADAIGEEGSLSNGAFWVRGYDPIEFVQPKRKNTDTHIRIRTAIGNTFIFRRAEPAKPTPAARLKYLRGELRAERISYDELHELQSLAGHIAPGDVELLEAAGVPEQT